MRSHVLNGILGDNSVNDGRFAVSLELMLPRGSLLGILSYKISCVSVGMEYIVQL